MPASDTFIDDTSDGISGSSIFIPSSDDTLAAVFATASVCSDGLIFLVSESAEVALSSTCSLILLYPLAAASSARACSDAFTASFLASSPSISA